jgi:hypothetical protein
MSDWQSLDGLCEEYHDAAERLQSAVAAVLPRGKVVQIGQNRDALIGIVLAAGETPGMIGIVLEHGFERWVSVRDVFVYRGKSLPRWVKTYLKRNG